MSAPAGLDAAALPRQVHVYEVGPRDGLQNEAATVPTADKVAFVEALAAAGLPHVEITSFVSPRWIPQLADHEEVASRARRFPHTIYSALVPNLKGLAGALRAGLPEVAIFLSASETHNRKNINRTIDEALSDYAEVAAEALRHGVRVRAYVSTVYGCPYQGEVPADRARDLARRLLELGAWQVSLGDTIGVANPAQVVRVLRGVLKVARPEQIGLHFHDTRGTALANVLAGLSLGVSTVDAAAGGLGGCPYAPGAAGNLATEDLVYMLHGMGIETGVDLDRLADASERIAAAIGHDPPGRYLRARRGERERAARKGLRAGAREPGAGKEAG